MRDITDEMRTEANNEILKYSTIAAASSLIPGKEFDPVADSLLQYQMIRNLESIYQIENTITVEKFAAVIIDNVAWKVVGSKITGLLKFLPPPFNTAAVIQIAWDFVTTFAIGHAFRKLFETAYMHGVDPNMSNIGLLVFETTQEAITYFVSNFTTILGMSSIVLEKVDIDIDKVADEGNKIFDGQEQLMKEFERIVEATKKAVSDLGLTQKDFDKKMSELADKIGKPSIEMLEAELNLREINGEEVSDLRSFLNFLKTL